MSDLISRSTAMTVSYTHLTDFSDKKLKKLKEIEDKGNSLLSGSKEFKQAIEDKKKEIADLEVELKELTEKRDTVRCV